MRFSTALSPVVLILILGLTLASTTAILPAHANTPTASVAPAPAQARPAVPDRYTHRPIVELFTGLWCPPCMHNMHPGLERYYERDWTEPDHPCHIIEFHVRWGRQDELATDESEGWAQKRGITGVPSYWADLVELEEGAGNPTTAYWGLKSHLNSVGDDEVEPVVLLVEQGRNGSVFNITVRMRYVGLRSELPVVLYVFMTEDEVRAWSSDLERYVTCRYVFRDFAIHGRELTLPQGEWVVVSTTWAAHNVVDLTKVHAVAVLYRPAGRAIASACDVCSAHDMSDHEPPALSGLTRAPAEVQPGKEVTIAVQATDNTGVMAVFLAYRVDRGDQARVRMSWNGTAYVATIGPFDYGDVVTYRVLAYDIPGNMASTAEESFTVGGEVEDTQPPVIDDVWAEPAEPAPGQDFYVYVMAHDKGPSGMAGITMCYSVNGEDKGCLLAEQVNATTWRAQIPGQPAGSTVEVHIIATDNAGNKAEETLVVHVKSAGAGGGAPGPGGAGPSIDPAIVAAVAIPVAAAGAVAVLLRLRR